MFSVGYTPSLSPTNKGLEKGFTFRFKQTNHLVVFRFKQTNHLVVSKV